MPLWNELEGTRVAGRFPLNTLLRSEGRTAWFATESPDGRPAVLSVAESMNDEDALLARLQAASRLRHANLITILETGSATVADPGSNETTHLVFALMEPFDEGLADVLRERALTPEEVSQIADSLLPALETIHAAGLVHGRIEPASVLASGETIKLRSDCIQQNDADSARREDVRGFAATLYQALTQRRPASPNDASQLPAPFAGIVRNGLGGQSTLADVRRALKGPSVETAVSAPAGRSASPPPARPLPPPPPAPPARSVQAAAATTAALEAGTTFPAATPASAAAPSVAASVPPEPLHTPGPSASGGQPPAAPRRPGATVAALAALIAVLLGFWVVFHRRPAAAGGQAAQATVAPAPPPASTAEPGGTSVRPNEAVSQAMGEPGANPAEQVRPSALKGKPSAVTPAGVPVAGAIAAHGTRDLWHVIAYTYDLQDKAQAKADELAQQHPDLSPQVFSPTGSRPYLVTLGGAMTRDQAGAVRNKARDEGLPHDIYIQNFAK